MKRFVCLLTASGLLWACQSPAEETASVAPEVAEPTAAALPPSVLESSTQPAEAEVSTDALSAQTVSDADLEERLAYLSKQDIAFVKTPFGRHSLQQVILREKLIRADAVARHLNRSDDYQALAEQKRAQLDAIYNNYTQHILEELWYQQQRDNGALDVTEQEINEYYKKYPYEMTIKQIILDNAQTADQVLRTLKRSPSNWNTMARQYSIAPKMFREESFTFMPGEFLPEIEVIAANSVQGSVQGFFKTGLGFHIIMKTSERRLSKKDAAPRIRAVLENKKLDKILETLQKKYEVTIDEQI